MWSSHLAGAHERQAFDHRCGRVAKLALERRRVQQRCPRAPTPEPGKGRRPKNRQSQRRKVFLPGCSVFSLSWPACAGAFLVPGPWFSGPASSGSCLFLFRLMFLFIGRGRHVPAPSGRDVGSSAGAPTQGPAFSGTPLRTCFSFISSRLPCSFPPSLLLYFRVCASRSGCFPATLDCSLLASSYPPFGLGKFYLHSAITVLTFLAVCEPDIYAPSM